MPVYKRAQALRSSLEQHHRVLERDDVEVVLALDEPTQTEAVIEVAKTYPGINWRIIENDVDHSWRSPTRALNVGLRHATGEYAMICSPESVFASDPVEGFLSNWKPGTFCVGFVNFDMNKESVPYGSLFARRADLEAVEGYDESYTTWGGDDDDIRLRLNLYNLEAILCRGVLLLHHEDKPRPPRPGLRERLARLAQVKDYRINQPNWGRDFSRLVYEQGRNHGT